MDSNFKLSLCAHVSLLAGGDVAMAQQKKPLWELCWKKDWAAVQQRIRDKDVGDVNEKDIWVRFICNTSNNHAS